MLFLALLAACAHPDRALVPVPVAYEAAPAELRVDDVPLLLTEATLTLGDLRFEEPATAWSWSLVPAAWAHPGHDFTGAVSGELSGTWTLDLLDDAPLGEASFWEGRYATARLRVEGTAVLAGTLDPDGTARPFRFEIPLDHEVIGVPFPAEVEATAPPGGITLSVDLAHALSFFDPYTTDSDGNGTLTAADEIVEHVVRFGLLSTPTYHLILED